MILTTNEEKASLDYVRANVYGLYKFYEFVDSKAKWSGKSSHVMFCNFNSINYWTDRSNTKHLIFHFKNPDVHVHYGRGIRVRVNVPMGTDIIKFECCRTTQYVKCTEFIVDSSDPNCSFDEIEKFIDAGLKHFRKLNAKTQIKDATEKIKAMSYQTRLIDAIPEDVELKSSNSGESIYGQGKYPSSIYIKKLKTKEDTFTIKFSGTFNVTEEQLIAFVKGFASGYPKKV